jgi:galactofuranosylgalactofuranosylrhamnosyl-N-acetylglucosaminyl-diphospho-decaprenol beta-1,5/1,6-galactofuranosyltransferase
MRRVLQRQILPTDGDTDVISLYVDSQPVQLDLDKYEVGSNRNAKALNATAMRQAVGGEETVHPDQIESRTALRVPAGDKLSFGTYFNGFAASYWRRWTVVEKVRLTVDVEGPGASIVVYRSTANGRSQRVDTAAVGEDAKATFTFDLTLGPFVDGGWYWYDVLAGDTDAVVTSAEWSADVPEDRTSTGTVDIAITTMNRPDFCARLLSQLGDDETLRGYLDSVMVMEQGKDKVVDSEYWPAAQASLGDLLTVHEQGNLGGSGGYARGQLESVRKGTATYTMMLDDDVVCEPESIVRAITFGDLARRPTIVGGHMFSLYARSRLHSYGEIVQPWTFWWQSAPGVFTDWDFSSRNLRSSRWLHKRIDVDYNGWFMCLVPRTTLEQIGLSLPLFLKWDDSEFGLRAKKAGIPTVSLPGAAVWHVPWTDKNDAVDWQAYFHQRNRFVAALLHSAYPRGGRMVRESRNHQIARLISMQYSTVEIRHQALLDVLEGPDHLHRVLPTRLAEINAVRKEFSDAQLQTDPDSFAEVKREKPPRKGRDGTEVPGRLSLLVRAGLQPLRQVKPPRKLSRTNPEAEVRAEDAKWYRLGTLDSAIVSMNDGASAALYRRDPETFRAQLAKTVEIHERLKREWPRLAREYREALPRITSPEAWEETLRPWRDA